MGWGGGKPLGGTNTMSDGNGEKTNINPPVFCLFCLRFGGSGVGQGPVDGSVDWRTSCATCAGIRIALTAVREVWGWGGGGQVFPAPSTVCSPPPPHTHTHLAATFLMGPRGRHQSTTSDQHGLFGV